MFYIKTKDAQTRKNILEYFKNNSILAIFHYIPLHSTAAGIQYGIFNGDDKYTTHTSQCIIRLPLYYNLEVSDQKTVIKYIKKFHYEKTAYLVS